MTYLRPERQPPTALLYRVFEIINRADVCVRDRMGLRGGPTGGCTCGP